VHYKNWCCQLANIINFFTDLWTWGRLPLMFLPRRSWPETLSLLQLMLSSSFRSVVFFSGHSSSFRSVVFFQAIHFLSMMAVLFQIFPVLLEQLYYLSSGFSHWTVFFYVKVFISITKSIKIHTLRFLLCWMILIGSLVLNLLYL